MSNRKMHYVERMNAMEKVLEGKSFQTVAAEMNKSFPRKVGGPWTWEEVFSNVGHLHFTFRDGDGNDWGTWSDFTCRGALDALLEDIEQNPDSYSGTPAGKMIVTCTDFNAGVGRQVFEL